MSHSIYLRAAKLADVGYNHQLGVCMLLDRAADEGFCAQRFRYEKIFSPSARSDLLRRLYWLAFDNYETRLPDKEARQRRVIALLLAHAMHLTGDLE
jgi:hypothetical protein